MSDFTEFEIVDDGPKPTPPTKPYRDAPARPKQARGERRERDRDRTPPATAIGRTPPNSQEAEEYLLSCCFLDGRDIVIKAQASHVSDRTFYFPANRIIWTCIVSMCDRGQPIDLATIAEELKTSRQLKEVGNYSYLTQISGRIPTTAQADFFILKLREMQCLREFINRATQAVENAYTYTGDMSEVLEPLKDINESMEVRSTPLDLIARPLGTFQFPVKDPNCLIGTKGRYLNRGGSLLIPAPAGIGKSTASYQMAAFWGTGRDFIGLNCIRPLRVMIIQCEDDVGDVGEVMESVIQGAGFTPKDIETLNQNVFCIRDRGNIGDAFAPALRAYARHCRPDLVIINPLMRYCPGLSKEEIAGPFLAQLDIVADEFQFALIAFHHTPKPPVEQPGRGKPQKRDAVDRQYTAFGSSALTNWARAIINITKVKNQDGVFIFQFVKRGRRAGLYRDVEQGAGKIRIPMNEVRVRYSDRKVSVGGNEYPMILWEKCDEQLEPGVEEPTPEPTTPSTRNQAGGRLRKFTNEEVVTLFPLGFVNRQPILQIMKRAFETLNMSKSTFMDYRFNLVTDGILTKHEDGRYYRPSVDDPKY